MTKRSSQSRARKAKAAQSAPTPATHTPGSARMSHTTRFGIIFAIVAVIVFWLVTRPPPPGQVWSAEHGHWHDANGGEVP